MIRALCDGSTPICRCSACGGCSFCSTNSFRNVGSEGVLAGDASSWHDAKARQLASARTFLMTLKEKLDH